MIIDDKGEKQDMDIDKVSWKHFEAALGDVHASTTKEMLERFKKLDQYLRRAVETEAATHAMFA